ncbi:MAG: hypothetical protein ACOX5R_14035 [bacterium]
MGRSKIRRIHRGRPGPDYLPAAHATPGSAPRPADRIFEPSNGRTSEGWIIRTNKGVYP